MAVFDFRRVLLFVTACVLGLVVSSCTTDDEDDFTLSSLYRIWYCDDGSSIQFNQDGTGLCKGDIFAYSKSGMTEYPFTFVCSDNGRNLDLTMEYGATFHFVINELSDTVLRLTDENGRYINFSSSHEGGVINTNKLLGKWGYGGYTLTEFTEDKMLNYNLNAEIPEKLDYRLIGNVIEVYEENEWWPMWRITRLDDDMLTLVSSDNPDVVYRHFRILDEEDTVGDISLIYDKDWVGFDDYGYVHMNFKTNGKMIFKDVDGSYDYTFSYNKKNNRLVMSDGEEEETFVIKKLTDRVLMLVVYGSQGDNIDEILELRTISETNTGPNPTPDPTPDPNPSDRMVKAICRIDDVKNNPNNNYPDADVWTRYEFKYDNKGRVSKVLFSSDKYFPGNGVVSDEVFCTTYSYDYSKEGILTVNETTEWRSVDSGTDPENLSLLDSRINSKEDNGSYIFTLDSEEYRIIKGSGSEYKYTEDGCLSMYDDTYDKINYEWSEGNLVSRSSNYLSDKYEYLSLPNDYSIDINGYIVNDLLPNSIKMPWEFFGKRSKNIVDYFENVYTDEMNRISEFYELGKDEYVSVKVNIVYY